MRFLNNKNMMSAQDAAVKNAVEAEIGKFTNEINDIKERLETIENAQAAMPVSIETENLSADDIHADNVYAKNISVEEDVSIQGNANAAKVTTQEVDTQDVKTKKVTATQEVKAPKGDFAEADIGELKAETLDLDTFNVGELNATKVDATTVEAENAEITNAEITNATVGSETVETLNVTDKVTGKDAEFTGNVTEKNTEIENLQVTEKADLAETEIETVKTGRIFVDPEKLQLIPENGWLHIHHISQGEFFIYLSDFTDITTQTSEFGNILFSSILEYRNHDKVANVRMSYGQKVKAFEEIYIDSNGEIWLKRGSAVADSRRVIILAVTEDDVVIDTWAEDAATFDISTAKIIELETGNETIHKGEFYQDGNAVIHGNLKVEGQIELEGLEAEHAEYLGTSDKVTADDNGNLSVGGNGDFAKNLNVGEDADIDGDLNVDGNIDFKGNITKNGNPIDGGDKIFTFIVNDDSSYAEFIASHTGLNETVGFYRNSDATGRNYDYDLDTLINNNALLNCKLVNVIPTKQVQFAAGTKTMNIISGELDGFAIKGKTNTDVLTIKGYNYKNCHFTMNVIFNGCHNVDSCQFSGVQTDIYSNDIKNCNISGLIPISEGDSERYLTIKGWRNCTVKITDNSVTHVYINQQTDITSNSTQDQIENKNVIISVPDSCIAEFTGFTSGVRIYARQIKINNTARVDNCELHARTINGSSLLPGSTTPDNGGFISNSNIFIFKSKLDDVDAGILSNVFNNIRLYKCVVQKTEKDNSENVDYHFMTNSKAELCVFTLCDQRTMPHDFVQSYLYNNEIQLEGYGNYQNARPFINDCELIGNVFDINFKNRFNTYPWGIVGGYSTANTHKVNKLFKRNIFNLFGEYYTMPETGKVSFQNLYGFVENIIRFVSTLSSGYSGNPTFTNFVSNCYASNDGTTTPADDTFSGGNNLVTKGTKL